MRLITKKTLLYTEMVMDASINYNRTNLEPYIGHDQTAEHPLAVQLGGCDPESVGEAAYICETFASFQSINLNCGCPSNRAKKCGFGAELMLEPSLVRQLVHSMQRRVTHTDVTVKCRIGVTPGRESFEELCEFVHAVRAGGARTVVLHARLCVLRGLTPAQNRSVPPLHHEVPHKLVNLFPDMTFVLNGGR